MNHRPPYTSSRFGRALLAFLVLLLAAPSFAVARDSWGSGPSDAVAPLGSGTEADPYIIATAENLYWLSLNIGKENLYDKYFMQTGDIDLRGRKWMPIGGSNGPTTTGTASPTFLGQYDGLGHSIKGLYIDWGQVPKLVDKLGNTFVQTDARATVYAYGLFGRLGGTVKNLVIDGAEFVQEPRDSELLLHGDVSMGILAGAVGDGASPCIQNVIINNSRIADSGSTANRLNFSSYMIGGLIGDIHADLISNTNASEKSMKISDIYTNVDVDIPNTERSGVDDFSNKGIQFYYGGIIGRARSLKTTQMPANVVATGTVNAPHAMVGPIFGVARYNSAAVNTFVGLQNGYAGDFTDKQKGTSSADAFRTCYFSGFNVYNYSDPSSPQLVTLTDAAPANSNTLGTRTFKKQESFTPALTTGPAYLAMFQGVNRGVYKGSLSDAVNLLAHAGYSWVFADGRYSMVRDLPIDLSLSVGETFNYTARYTTTRPAADSYSLKWYHYTLAGQQECIKTDTGSSSSYATIDSHVLVYLFDGDRIVESRCLYNNSLEATLVDNTFPNPYTIKAAFYTDSLPAPFEVVDLSVQLLKKSDMSAVRYWSSEEYSTIEQDIPITTYETVVRVTAKPVDPDVNGECYVDLPVPNYIKISGTKTSSTPDASNFKLLPAVITLKITDRYNTELDIPGVNYFWTINNSADVLERGETGEGPSTREIMLPISASQYGRYFYGYASHPTFITDFTLSSIQFTGFFVPYTANFGASKPYQGASINNLTDNGDDHLTFQTVFVDNYGNHLDGLYGLDIDFLFKDKPSGVTSYANLTNDVVHTCELVSEGNNYRFTMPYPYISDLYLRMILNDQYGARYLTQANFDDFNFKTVPFLEKVGGGHYRVKLKIGDLEHDVFAGLNLKWKIRNTTTGQELPVSNQLQIDPADPTGRTVMLNFRANYNRTLYCEIDDYYGNRTTAEFIIPGQPVSIVDDGGNSYHVEIEGSQTVPAGYTIKEWFISDIYGTPYNTDHLAANISADKTSITVDDAVTERVLNLVVENEGIDIKASLLLPVLVGDIVLDDGTYKAQIDGSTDLSAITPFTYVWNVNYDGAEYQDIPGTSLTTSQMTYPDYNSVITLHITDRYSTFSTSVRYMTDSRVLSITREDDVLTALIDGAVPADGTWKWYGVSGDVLNGSNGYPLNSNSNTLTIDRTNNQYNNYMAIWTGPDNSARLRGYYSTRNIIYVYDEASTRIHGGYPRLLVTYPDGNNRNNGRTPQTAVKTMARAYELLDRAYSPDENIIVVMGHINEEKFLDYVDNYMPNPAYMRHATLTGSYGEISEMGTLFLGIPAGGNSVPRCLGGVTKFHDIILSGGGGAGGYLLLYCCLHDLTFDNNVKVVGYRDINKNQNGIGDYTAPEITIIAGYHEYDNYDLVYPEGNTTPGRTTIRLLSGNFGRIIGGARNSHGTAASTLEQNRYNHTSHNIYGHPDYPSRVDIEIAIKHINDMLDYTPDKTTPYKYDIGLLVGGVTDGSIYTDSRLFMSSGTVGRFISGNISYSRYTGEGYPTDGFYGSTVLTLDGGEIGELIGGTLGRHEQVATATDKANVFFYGRSIINIKSGTISGDIYGAGAGGVVGVGDDERHTIDSVIPYLTGTGTGEIRDIAYGPYSVAKDKLPTMVLHDTDSTLEVNPKTGYRNMLDLNKSYTEVNIYGGTINGDVYGGAYGYSKQIKVQQAMPQAGYLYGNTKVRIYGGTIKGNVYGGGAGSKEYNTDAKKDPALNADDFLSLANVYGNTSVEISGGIIEGSVYAGSKGIAEMPDMAYVRGNTDLKIYRVRVSENTWRTPVINGDVYGGSVCGRITGGTNVEIKGGNFGRNIYGGSEGTVNSMAVIHGDTKLNISGGSFFTEENVHSISDDKKIAPEERMFNIYGGGNINCVVVGDTHVDISQSLFNSHRNLLETGIYRTFEDCLADDTYRKFCVYGGGRGERADVAGDTYVNINIVGGASVPSAKPVDVANNQQFVKIVGGGYAGAVYGNTNVTIDGNTHARDAYGGSMYGRIEGEARMKILGASLYNVYGGCLLGDVQLGSDLTIGVKATPGHEAEAAAANRGIYIYNHVYGGNDVGGIVGYSRTDYFWKCSHGDQYLIRYYDKDTNDTIAYPYSYHQGVDDYGVNLKINGGNILGNVYGAGNGHHTGYYVPNGAASENHVSGFTRVQFTEGPAYLYRLNTNDPDHNGCFITDDAEKATWGLYNYRPRTKRVRMHIGGNSATDRVNISGCVYGGGHACTVGEFNPEKDVLKDPSRYLGGGTVKINFGSHVTVADGVYMGSRGDIIGKQTVTDGSTHSDKILDSDYDYHYYDAATKSYKLGFPNSIEGRNRFHAYMRLMDMDAEVQLTFWDDPYSPTLHEFKPYDADNIDPLSLAAQDVRFGSFYAGGARGSMIRHTESGHIYHYVLPEGLTVDTHVVGGSDDAIIRFYEYSPDFMSYDINKPIFTYHGGIVYDVNDGGVHGYGGGVVQWHNAPEGTDPKELLIGNETPRGERVVVKLDVRCQFDPRPASYYDENGVRYDTRYGGLIYGGCFNSGITNGSVEVVSTGNLLGSHYESDDYRDFLAWSSLRNNVGRVFGGGYGKNSSIRGRTNIYIGGRFRGFNIFGGGMRGDVSRGTNITVSGLALVYNAIYGGSMLGNIGLDPLEGVVHEKNIGTNIRLISGGVDRVYGGSFMGNVYGGTKVVVSDEGQPAGTPRLMVGSIYGGNDVSGNITPDPGTDLCTDIHVSEEPRADKASYNLSHPSPDNPDLYYGGYPMVGSIYGAGNGNMDDYIKGVTIDYDTHRYKTGIIHIANGKGADIDMWELGRLHTRVPDVESTHIRVKGGTIVNLYGGGSMCTVTGHSLVEINYNDTVPRAGFLSDNQNPMIWGILRLFEEIQQNEVTEVIGHDQRFAYQIYRVFGGNSHMDMAIQPTWNLIKGNIYNLYSGGNFGKMTCPDGLKLDIDSKDLRIAAVYGGGRVGNIEARDTDGKLIMFPADKYGTTLNIKNGYIGDVYGGNNVAGTVYNGTNINLMGAISGNVYGSGNGNYLYKYDFDGTASPAGHKDNISESYAAAYGGRYFILPPKEAYPGKIYGNTPEEIILAINSYRPNVEKSYINIEGAPDKPVYVLGNVYCGGNSSTILANPAKPAGSVDNIKFRIGSHVALGGVFLGSNGQGLANAYNIAYLASLNGIGSMAKHNDLPDIDGYKDADVEKMHFNDVASRDSSLYKNLLSIYMRAAEVTALPDQLILPDDAKESYIGNFTIGGNFGSMMVDSTINLEFPKTLTIMGRIVCGTYNSRVEYGSAVSLGGMNKPLREGVTDRLNITIRSRFKPWRLLYDAASNTVRLVNNRVDFDGNLVADADVDPDKDYYYPEGIGNIFGGCFTSGRTTGNINIDMYSDYLGHYDTSADQLPSFGDPGLARKVDYRMMMNNVGRRHTVMCITGAGYGPLSHVDGDIHIRLLPEETDNAAATTHPTLCTIFGGSHNGTHVGTCTTEIRDGMVFSSIYGGSRAALKYGSSQVIVGYPQYYICRQPGVYTLDRADKISYVAKAATDPSHVFTHGGKDYNALNADDKPVIKQTVRYSAGDIVAANVVDCIIGYSLTEASTVTDIDGTNLTDYFTHHREAPTNFSSKWDNIDINIGYNKNMNDLTAPYYGGGGIYGGGHALNSSAMSLSGVSTQLAYTAENNPDGVKTSPTVGYGGNSTIIVGDNPANCAVDAEGKIRYATTGPDGEAIKDHVSISTGHYVPVKIKAGADKIGRYVQTSPGVFEHQSSGPAEEGVTYYDMETEGGIYGDGRRTFVENFRAVDIEGYGYADYSPQAAKLLSSFQRMDLLSLTDCCLQLQGDTDYATNAVDATPYSVARVGELRLNSSLKGNLTPSVVEATGNLLLDVKRSRNYMGFFHSVHYLGAIHSSTPMTPDPDDLLKEGTYRDALGVMSSGENERSYMQDKKNKISKYESIVDTDTPEANAAKNLAYKQRNLATAPNLIGINNGYTLKVQNVFTTPAAGEVNGIVNKEFTDNIYYGPIIGVVEVKLLTLAQDEGGGYIYAFNNHEDTDCGAAETSGNFVYPAAVDETSDNYIVDDCYPDGYYDLPGAPTAEEQHYWYVTGHHYYYNATLTGYTYNGPEINFRLNNADNLILLSGIVPSQAETIEIESITWEDHTDTGYKCALTDDLDDTEADSRAKYELYLTIDKNTDNSYNLGDYGHAFVARIPNGNGDDSNHAYGTDEDGRIQFVNNYSNYAEDNHNSPTIGIRLRDTDAANQDPAFFHKHLEDPDNLVIKIKATDVEGKENFYTIRLDIVYLQGPYINGKIDVENCALPGEYIYANTQDVEFEMDESLTVTGKRWYLYPIVKANDEEVYSWDDSPSGRVDVSRYLMDNIAGDINRIELPARYYQNGWKVGYSIVVNGQDFPLPLPEEPTNILTVHNYHRMSTVPMNIKEFVKKHNPSYPFEPLPGTYKHTVYGFDIDLDLVGGALVYIEDDEDFALFTKYVNYCNEVRRDADDNVIYHDENGVDVATLVGEVLPGYNPYAFISGIENRKTVEGYYDTQDIPNVNVKNPTGAQNIRFMLCADVRVTDECMPISEFRGRLNGRGHNIYFDTSFKGRNFIEVNYGEIRDIGFTSSGAEDDPGTHSAVVNINKGLITNCYYYNYPKGHPEADDDFSASTYASLIGSNQTEVTSKLTYTGVSDNCYQNTNMANANSLKGVRYARASRFHNGMIAYNLNQEYLKARYNSRDNDALVHRTMIDATTDSRLISIDYLLNFYSDGEYRYAFTRSEEHPEGLRLASNFGIPNYNNYMGTGRSMHISDTIQSVDSRRWFKVAGAEIAKRDKHGNILYDKEGHPLTTDEGYFPIYLYDADHELAPYSDFIFFGQHKSDDDQRDYYPRHISYETRMYRAGGFYGSDTDLGVYFNRDITVMHPDLTAIDFTGHNDLRDTSGERVYDREWKYYHTDRETGITDTEYNTVSDNISYFELVNLSNEFDMKQMIYYPPVLDLPGGVHSSYLSNILSFKVNSNSDNRHHDKVTKNLLVYTPQIGDDPEYLSEDDNNRLFGILHYTRMQQWGDMLGETPQDRIIGHHLYEVSHPGMDVAHFHAANGLFHLVDSQDFNAPIEFYVAPYEGGPATSGRAWMLRTPRAYSSRPESDDPDVFTISKDSWESIALPFTCNRVWAVNSLDYVEKYSRGQITHFYGSDPNHGLLRHDYWLRGLVDTAADTYNGDDVIAAADFARPGKSTAEEKLYEITDDYGNDQQMRGDYTYLNDWFYNSYKDLDYNEHHNQYGQPIVYKDYCYLTKNAPYIVAFPGEDYYEFDLSGNFYNSMNATTGCHPQEILYEFSVDEIDPNNNFQHNDNTVRIPITDDYATVLTTTVHGDDGTLTAHHSTFKRMHDDMIQDNMYVLNVSPVTVDVRGASVTLPAGSCFINCKDFGITEILPFRTYLTVDLPGGSKAPARFISIGRGIADNTDIDADVQDEPEEPETPEDDLGSLNIWVEGNTLVVETPCDTQLQVFNTLGQAIRLLNAYSGTNRYTGIPAGFYIVGGTKVYIGH